MPLRIRPNLTSNFSLALASLFIATVLWLIAKQDELTEKDFEASIHYDPPANALIELSAKTATVVLRFPSWQESRITEASCWVQIETAAFGDPRAWCGIDEQKSSPQPLALDPPMVVLKDLPNTIQVVSVKPAHLQVFGRLLTVEADVQAVLNGDLAPGFQLSEPPKVSPSKILLTGPLKALNALGGAGGEAVKVQTEPIDLSGGSRYVEREASLVLPNGVEPVDPDRKVSVLIAIKEKAEARTVARVPIRVPTFSRGMKAQFSPTEAQVTLQGPKSIVAKLDPGDFSITPKIPVEERVGFEADVALECQFHERVSGPTREAVEISGFSPKSVHVRMIASESGATATPPPTPAPFTPLDGDSFPPPTPAPRLTPLAIDNSTTSSLDLDLNVPRVSPTGGDEGDLKPLRPGRVRP